MLQNSCFYTISKLYNYVQTNILCYDCMDIINQYNGVIFLKQLYCIRLKQLRLQKSYTQSDIAYILCIRQEQYSKYESGVRELPLLLLIKLCKIYRVSADYILGL